MKVRTLFGVVMFLALLALGSASAQVPGANHYLVLGDSIPFGFITQAGYAYINPHNFIPYADYVSLGLHLNPVDAACPGETSGSYLSSTATDNGCGAFRANFPLHVTYASTQAAFATSYLKTHRDVRLVTIQLGANDGFLLEAQCATAPDPQACMANGAPQLFATVASNMANILAAIRSTGYHGVIVIVNYYSLDYSDANQTMLTAGLNQALSTPASAFGAVVADVFSAFKTAATNPFANGKTCMTGLLNVDPQNQTQCDVHPGQSGDQLIASVIVEAYYAAGGGS